MAMIISIIRLDKLILEIRLALDINEATALVMAGKVLVPNERRSPTPGMQVRSDIEISVVPDKRFVSRGGEKLARAFEMFDLSADFAVARALEILGISRR